MGGCDWACESDARTGAYVHERISGNYGLRIYFYLERNENLSGLEFDRYTMPALRHVRFKFVVQAEFSVFVVY